MKREMIVGVAAASGIALVMAFVMFAQGNRSEIQQPTTHPTSGEAPTAVETVTEPLDPPGQQTNPVDPERLSGTGGLGIAVGEFPSSWNPWLTTNDAIELIMDIMSPRLHHVDADGVYHWDPIWLDREPTEVTTQESTTVTYNLNPLAVWSDGVPITAADFISTWQACVGASGPRCAGRGFDLVASVAVGESDREIVVTYSQPYADWPLTFARGPFRFTSEVEAAWVSLDGHDGSFSGPYRYFHMTDDSVTLRRNPFWWSDQPELDSITIRLVADQDLGLAYQRGDIDAFWVKDANTFADTSSLDEVQIRQFYGRTSQFLVVNTASGVLSDPMLRRAVRVWLDREAISASDLAGFDWSMPILSNPVWRIEGAGYEDFAERSPLWSAEQYLDGAGYSVDAEGNRTVDGQVLTVDFLIPSGDSLIENEAFAVRAQLRGLGINVRLVYEEESVIAQRVADGEFDMTAATRTDRTALENVQWYVSGNQWGYVNAMVDDLFIRARAQTDQQAREALLMRISRLVWEDVPVIPLYETPEILMTRPTLANLGPDGLGTTLWERVGWTV